MPKIATPTVKDCAAIYLRVSTDEQIEGFGLEVQHANCEQYAKAFGIAVCKVYSDEGVSGAKPTNKRPALTALIEAAQRGEFNQVIVPSIDRMARKLKLFLDIWDVLEAIGLKIVVVKERFETDSASGMLMRNILATFADYERSVIRERTTGGRRKRAQKDGERGGTLPLGYKRLASGKFAVDQQGASVVRTIFSLRGQKQSYGAIAEHLNGQGYSTQRGHRWHASSVREIALNEPKYRGAPMNGSSVRWPMILSAIQSLEAEQLAKTLPNPYG